MTEPAKSTLSTDRLQQALGLGVVLLAAAALFVASSWEQWFGPVRYRYADARALFDAQRWDEASQAYAQVADRHPDAGQVWFEYAYSVHSSGEFQEAIALHQRASEFSQFHATARYNLACALTLVGRHDEAINVLEDLERRRQFNRGLRSTLESDPELDALRSMDRFRALIDRLIPPEQRQPPSAARRSV